MLFIYDSEILADLLNKTQNCLNKIQLRVQSIDTAKDLTNSPKGVERLDLLCMPLIVIGELVKKIDKITDQSLLKLSCHSLGRDKRDEGHRCPRLFQHRCFFG
jgi:hypothetical protein